MTLALESGGGGGPLKGRIHHTVTEGPPDGATGGGESGRDCVNWAFK